MADIARKANAQWMGDLKGGKGNISTESGTVKDAQYSFGTRFENGTGTNPEELLAAAHAGCFTMQLCAMLAGDGHDPQDVRTEATCEMVKDGPGFKVSAMRLDVRGKVGGIDQAGFDKYVAQAAEMCPLSKVMQGNVEITHKAVLE
ncbi:OsmC family protein [Deinococcus marmoris]|uniref:OsmC family protein n=1 Tax=Deinococcus marmoris TaxID=249408 RepID=UPI0004966414|nr:OsmC family protein [Deinococcus marmoris]